VKVVPTTTDARCSVSNRNHSREREGEGKCEKERKLKGSKKAIICPCPNSGVDIPESPII